MAARTSARKVATKKAGAAKASTSRPKAKRTAKKTSKAKTVKKPAALKSAGKAAAKKTVAKKKTVTEKAKTASARKKVSRRKGPTSRSRRANKHSMITPAIKRRLRQHLLAKYQDLLRAYTNSKGDTREQRSDGTEDYIDYAVSSYDREFMLSLTELEQKELLLVEEALGRMKAGGYGLCLASGEEIPLKRLEVQPWARYSVRIQELEDQGLLVDHADDDASDEDEDDTEFGEIEDEELPDREVV